MTRTVAIGETVVVTDPGGTVSMVGLGSCVGVFLAVPGRVVAAAHVLLPEAGGKTGAAGKYADTAVDSLVGELRLLGLPLPLVRVSLAGGAQVLQIGGAGLDVGYRNADAVRSRLARHGLRPVADLTGGTRPATVRVPVATGILLPG